MKDAEKPSDAILEELKALRAVLDSLPYVIDVKDREGRYLYSNQRHRKFLGVSSLEEVVGKTVFDFFPKNLAQSYFDSDREVLETGKGYFRESEYAEWAGQDQWRTTFKLPVRDGSGRITSVVVGSLDVTERAIVERQLDRERELLHTLMDNIPDTIYFKDRDGKFTHINKAQAKILGVSSPEEAVGKSDFDFFNAETAEETRRDEQRIIATGEPLIGKTERIRFPDGSVRWVSATKVPLRDPAGEITGLVGISRDIHAHKLMEDRLQEERRLLRTLIDNMPDFIFVKDRQSRFVITNKAHLRELGEGHLHDVLGKTDFEFFPKEFAQKYFDDEQEIMSSGVAKVNMEEMDISTDGKRHWLSTTKVPVRGSDGSVTAIVGISRDISDRKLIEEELRRAKDELEVRVEERTADLQEANKRLEVRLNQLNFLTRTSYELAQYVKMDNLLPAILDAFVARFGRVEASLCVREEKEFSCRHTTPGLASEKARSHCEKALLAFAEKQLQTPLMVYDWTKDKWLHRFSWPAAKDLPCYLAIPLLADNTMISCVQIFTTADFAETYEREKPLLTTLSAHAAVCQSNAAYYLELGERARLEGELEAARSIQRSYTPKDTPPIPHVDVKGVYYPAFEVGGDYLDYFQTEQGDWVVVIADVCGKGIPAALHMTVLRSAFRVEGRHSTSAKQIVCSVNESMRMHLDNKSFVTALCLVISRDGTTMKYARAGHPMLLSLGNDGAGASNVPCAGVAIGLVADPKVFASLLQEVELVLQKGDRFLAYTDGLTEALNPSRDAYGFKRLCGVLDKERSHDPEKIISAIMGDVKKFTRDAPYHDDLTMLAINVH